MKVEGKIVLPAPAAEFDNTQTEEEVMGDPSIKKVASEHSPKGKMGQKYLASGISLSMRIWENEAPNGREESHCRDYETVGYVISGQAELHLEGQQITLNPGDCWVVPKGAEHAYHILKPFTAVEATSPPAPVHGRDEA